MEKDEEMYSYWRYIWQVTSGSFKNVHKEEVDKILNNNETEILQGILLFKQNDDNGASKPSQHPAEVSEFLKRTATHLHVNENVAWKVLKSYIINEYCGSIRSIQKLKYEMEIIPMLKNIWKFFSSERMFLLKIFKNAVEFKNDKDHPYSEVYKTFIEKTSKTIWKSLVDQLDYLISEIQGNSVKEIEDEWIRFWIQRNLHETIEIVHCLIMFSNNEPLVLSQFDEMLKLCKKHGFGAEPLFYRGYELADKNLIKNVTMSEVALLLCIANRFWIAKDHKWYKNTKDLEAEMQPLAYRQEHGAVCFIWVMLHLTLPNKKALFDHEYEKLGIRAASLGCNKFFADMATNEMFHQAKCLLGATVQDSLFNMFSIGLENIPFHEMIEFNSLFIILSELLKVSHICDKFFELSNIIGCVPVWSFAVELFPKHVELFSRLAEAIILSESSHSIETIKLLEHLPYYTEEYNPNEVYHTSRINQSDNLDLVRLIQPKTVSSYGYTFEIPANTQAIIKRESNYCLIHYSYEMDYWFVFLTEMNLYLHSSEPISDEIYLKMIDYMQVMIAVLKTDPNATKKPIFCDVVRLIFSMMDKFSQASRVPGLKFFATCLDICTELLHKCRMFVCTQMETYKLLPNLARNDFVYKHIFNINFLEHGKLGKIMIRNEYAEQELLLISYLKFLRTSFLISNGSLETIELPGVVFILKEIFPYLMIWFSKSNNKNHIFLDVLYEVVHFLFEIFRYPFESLKSPQHKQMRKIVYEFFVNEMCGRELLRILSLGNGEIQNIMEGQTNWRVGRGIRYISSIQKIMAILMQLLTQRKIVLGEDSLTPLENMIYNESEGAHTVQAIASFVNHPFNESIPNLAVRLLKKLTTELQMSMLAALDLEPDQVRMMFIQRLRDRFESEELKLAIIELITACIPKQSDTPNRPNPSKDPSQSSSTAFNEGIGSFLVEYLYSFNNTDSTISTALLCRIMEVFHVLWMNQKEILIAEIVKDVHFWPSLCFLLFEDICLSDKTYSEIFNIIGKEIHKRRGNVEEPLKKVLKKMFEPEHKFIDKWMKHCFFNKDEPDVTMECDEMPPEDCLILALKDFLIICVHFHPKTFFQVELQTKLADDCRNALKKHVLCLTDSCVITFLAELYYYLIVSWGEVCFKNENSFIDIVCVIQKVCASYIHLPNRFVVTILAIIIHSTRALKDTAVVNPYLTEQFIESLGIIFNTEFDSFVNECNKKNGELPSNTDYKMHGKFAMVFEAYNSILNIQNSIPTCKYNQFLCQTQLLHKLYDCIKRFISSKKSLPMTKVAIDLLITYAQSPNVKDFLGSDIDYHLWEKMTTPMEYRHSKYLEFNGIVPWDVREWWLLYRKMITLLTVLLQKHKFLILKKILMFVSLHEEYITEILLLERYTVDDDALDLIKMTLVFLRELFTYQAQWTMDHESSLKNILDAIKMNLNYSSSVIVRPTVLKYCNMTVGQEETFATDSMPADLLVEIMNKLTDIITLATNCVLQFSPPLFNLLRDDTDYSSWPLQVGTSFGIPTFADNDSCELTFGLLFCVSSIYVRILQQISITKKQQLVTSPREILIARKSRIPATKAEDLKEKLTPKDPSSSSSKPPQTNEEKSATPNIDKESPFTFSSSKTGNPKGGFIRIDYLNPMCIISAVENFTTYANPIKCLPWYSKLNEEKACRALETVVTLIASQVSHILYHDTSLNRETRLIKRELSSELQSFHDFVKRRLIDTHRYMSPDRSNLFRKKFGNVEEEAQKPGGELSNRGLASKRSLDMTANALPATSGRSLSMEEKILTTNGLSEVKLINEDYLHFLSIWFSYFLHFE